MKILSASLLFCAMMALTRAADVPEADPGKEVEPQNNESVLEADPGAEAEPLTDKAVPEEDHVDKLEGDSDLVKSLRSCPTGWTTRHGRCFRYISTRMSWGDAERHCLNQRGHLASVHSFQEYRDIQSIIWQTAHAYPATWLGGSDAQREGIWLWSDGSSFNFRHWAPRQPDNFFNEDCLLMNYGDQLKYGDKSCSSKYPLICARWL